MADAKTSPKVGKRTRRTNDFFGPTYRIKFYAPNQVISPSGDEEGTEVPQLTREQEVLDELAIQNYVTGITIETYTGMMKCEVVIAPPFHDALNILKKRAIQFNGTMGIKWGYTDQNLLSDEHLFTIVHPRVQFSKDVTITITGIDTMSNGLRRQTTKKVISRDQFKMDILILTELASRYNFKIDRTYAPLSSDPKKPKKVDKEKTTAVSEPVNDWLLFKTICQENDLNFNIGSGNTIYLSEHTSVMSLDPDYRFFWYGTPEGPHDIPMMSFTTNVIPSIFTPDSAIAQGLLVTKTDTDTNSPKVRVLDGSKSPEFTSQGDPKVDSTAAGTTQQQGQPSKTDDAVVVPTPTFDFDVFGFHVSIPNLGADKTVSLARESHFTVNTTATIVAPGHPDVVPPLNLEVVGTGPFDGNYLLISAKHALGQAGYEMTLSVVRTISPNEAVFGNPAKINPSANGPKSPSSGASPDST